MSIKIEYLNPADWSLHVVDVDNDEVGKDWIKINKDTDYLVKMGNDKLQVIRKGIDGVRSSALFGGILWQRHTQPEELLFVDDEPKTAWGKQEGGSHYKDLKIQPMQYALDNKLDYAQANVVKYVTRHANKNGKEDLLKAIHNIELMIEYYYGDKEQSQ